MIALPHEQWKALLKRIMEDDSLSNLDALAQIALIDDSTTWSEVEPQWWLEMKDVEKTLLEFKKEDSHANE